MKVLVTGASGMLGAATARALAARGDAVTVLQRRPSGLGLPEVLADVADAAAVQDAVRGHQAVIHLAAKVGFTGPWSAYQRANVDGTRAVLNACRSAGVTRLVHVSSPSVAHAGRPLVGEGAAPADPHGARGAYARSKALAEQVALRRDRERACRGRRSGRTWCGGPMIRNWSPGWFGGPDKAGCSWSGTARRWWTAPTSTTP